MDRSGDVQQDYAIASLLLEENQSELYRGCSGFYSSEAACVTTPHAVTAVCNQTEFNRLRTGITPAPTDTASGDTLLIFFYQCWTTCNLTFNADIDCNTKKFALYSDYRSKQRDTTETDGKYAKWQYCYASCNNGLSGFEQLKDYTYAKDPFASQ